MAVQIEWVNHASFVERHGSVALLSDPWLFGSAFNDGWDLLVPSVFTPGDVASVTHLWVSHQHPDHFAPATLKQILPEVRARVPLLFQRTKDQQVARYSRRLGFVVQELENHRWYEISDEFRVMLGRVPFYDSWLLSEAGGQRILNLNDCVMHRSGDLKRLAKRVGPIDLLLTQFSYANWIGGPDDPRAQALAAQEKLDWMEAQLRALRPRQCIPFASFVIFSHVENAYLNRARNTVTKAVELIDRLGVQPIVLAPGDRWAVGTNHDNAAALNTYEAAPVDGRPLRTSESVPLEELERLGDVYRQRIDRKNSALFLWLARLPPMRIGGPILIHLWDYDKVVRVSAAGGLSVTGLPADRAAIQMHSQSLSYTLKMEWGVDTLSVNGRFRGDAKAYRRLLRAFAISVLNNNGRSLSPRLLADPWLVRRAFDRFVLRAS